jgi:hypothetical protein
MTLIDEMEEFNKYQIMRRSELCEFLGRLAELIYPTETYGNNFPLHKKLEKLLGVLFPIICNMDYITPSVDKNLESDSDYEDEAVDEILRENI